MDLILIARSWIIAANPSQQDKEIAEERLKICNSCEFLKGDGLIPHCGVCHCPIKGLIFCPEKSICKKNKWKN